MQEMCQRCGQAPATVHVTHLVMNEKRERHLCESCAQAEGVTFAVPSGWGPSLSLGQLLGGLMPSLRGNIKDTGVRCSVCGWTPAQFQETGRLGCDACYTAFSPALEPLVRRIHGSTEHRGKIPARVGQDARLERQLTQLKMELQAAISREEFEQAARLRDEIRTLEQGRGGDGE